MRHAKRRRSSWAWSRSRAERHAEQGHSSYDEALRRHRRHVLAVRVGAGVIGALVLLGTFRALTFSAPSTRPPDGAQMSTIAAAATAAVPGTSLVRIDAESVDTWQVTVADADGRCWLVRVARADGALGALPPPAIVACPARVVAEADPGPEAEPGSDVDLVARGFVEAYLTASPNVRRYLAPDVEMELPKPVRSVTVERVRSRPVEAGEVASVSATADGTPVGYRLRLVEIEDRLWVEDLFAGPFIGTLTTEPANEPADPLELLSGRDGLASDSTTTAPGPPEGASTTSSSPPATAPPGGGSTTTGVDAPGGEAPTSSTAVVRPTLPPQTQPPGPGE